MVMNAHAHDTYTTHNLEILVIVKIKYFPYLGKISPNRVIKACRNISYKNASVIFLVFENLKIMSSSRINKPWVVRISLVKNKLLE